MSNKKVLGHDLREMLKALPSDAQANICFLGGVVDVLAEKLPNIQKALDQMNDELPDEEKTQASEVRKASYEAVSRMFTYDTFGFFTSLVEGFCKKIICETMGEENEQ